MPRWKRSSNSSSESSYSSKSSSMSTASSTSSSASSSSRMASSISSRTLDLQHEVRPDGRANFCAICKVDTHNFNLNYGAPTCLSCRAFFRRIIQQKLKQELRCRSGSNCVITVENRKKCKRCRFEACLKAGMKPESVLDETQYQRRFRKMIQRQQEEVIEAKVSSRKSCKEVRPFHQVVYNDNESTPLL